MDGKVLCIGMSSNLGGIESYIINFWRKLDKDNVKIDFMNTVRHIYFEDEIIKGKSDLFYIEPRKKNILKYIYNLYVFFKKKPEYKVVHLHLNTCSSIESALVAKLFGRKVIFHSHSEWKGTKKLTQLLHFINRPILNYIADERLACSISAGKWMYGNKEFKIINNAIDAGKYRFDENKRDLERKKLGLQDKLVMGHIGSFSYAKNHEFLIDVFKEVNTSYPNSKLVLVGDGRLRSVLEKKINKLELENSVILTGVQKDVTNVLQGIDILVFPSKFEGLPIVLIEAQAAGLPCIVANTIPKEVILTNLVQRISLDKTVSLWSDKIIESYKVTKRRDTYEEIIYGGYDIGKVTKELEDIYYNMFQLSK